MSYCGTATSVKREPHQYTARPLRCRSWSCPDCQPARRKRLIAEVLGGNPTALLTLTQKPDAAIPLPELAKQLTRAWRCLRLALMRKYKLKKLPFLAVMEATKTGTPHLHITIRGPWLDQKYISSQMARLTGSPICDIRKIDRHRGIATYVAKYIGKQPKQFGTCKRYYKSQDYELRPDRGRKPPLPPGIWHERLNHDFRTVITHWITWGYAVTIHPEGYAVGVPP